MTDYTYPAALYLGQIGFSPIKPKHSPTELGRAMIAAIAGGELSRVDPPVDHYHVPGVYGRKITVPAGVVVVTQIHKSRHLTIALKGRCTVVDQDGNRVEVEAPGVWVTEPGTQRSVLCHTETQWITVHGVPDGLTDIDALEALLVENPFTDEQPAIEEKQACILAEQQDKPPQPRRRSETSQDE